MQLLQLFLKASQDKQFVCEEADRALYALTSSLSPAPTLEKLLQYAKHRHPKVRAKATVSIHNSVARLVRMTLHPFVICVLYFVVLHFIVLK